MEPIYSNNTNYNNDTNQSYIQTASSNLLPIFQKADKLNAHNCKESLDGYHVAVVDFKEKLREARDGGDKAWIWGVTIGIVVGLAIIAAGVAIATLLHPPVGALVILLIAIAPMAIGGGCLSWWTTSTIYKLAHGIHNLEKSIFVEKDAFQKFVEESEERTNLLAKGKISQLSREFALAQVMQEN